MTGSVALRRDGVVTAMGSPPDTPLYRRPWPDDLYERVLADTVHDQMLAAGYAVAAVDYRLAREAGFPGMLLDIKAAVRWLRGHATEFGIDPERVVFWGESAGGHLAPMAAMCTALDGAERTGEHLEQSESPMAVVDWYGPTDLAAMSRLDLGRDSEEVGPTDDRIVPVNHSRDLVPRLRAVGAVVDYLEVPGADHVGRGAPSVPGIVAASLEFVARRPGS